MPDLPLSYASRGIPVFPCRAAPEVICGRRYVAKSPIPTNGYKGATTSERIIRIWADRHPGCLWGMPTGRATGVWVLDIDAKHGASPDSLPHPLPPTRTVRTGSGGWHFYFTEAGLGCGTGRLPAGVDVRGNGGLVILPGNPGYTLESDAPVAEAPEWLLALIRPKPYVPRPGVPYQPQDHDAYVAAALNAELSTLAGWRVERGVATFKAACNGPSALVRVQASAPHAHFSEFGTQHSAPQPFMGPAYLEAKQDVPRSIATDLKIEMEKSARRIAARAAKKGTK